MLNVSFPTSSPETSQRDRAYAELRRALLLQEIKSGARLGEVFWSNKLDVNRTAVRESFARLEAEGLIERGQKSGYMVPQLSDDDIHEILEVRCCLECGAIKCLLGRNPKPPLEPLENAIEHLERLIDDNYLLAVTEADRRFHESLVHLSANKRLMRVYSQAPLPMIHDKLIGTQYWSEECRRTLEDHKAILKAIKENDEFSATTRLREHLDQRYLDPIQEKN